MFKLLIPMKILTTLSTIILLFAIASCDEDCTVPTTVIGEWTWVKSVGGFGGHTITPASEGYTKQLVIDDHFYTEYINDSIDFKTQHTIQQITSVSDEDIASAMDELERKEKKRK